VEDLLEEYYLNLQQLHLLDYNYFHHLIHHLRLFLQQEIQMHHRHHLLQ
jgi:hypothetical protein